MNWLNTSAGFGVGAMVGKAGMTMGRAILTGAATGATEGAVGGAGNYLLGPGPHDASGLLRSTTVGGLTGGVTGGAGGAAGHALASRAGGTLDAVSPDPNILSGHGGIHPSDTATFTVPEGSTVHFYSPHDTSISDPLGNSIELGHPPVPTQVAGPGDTVPDYVLHAPTGLHIAGNPTTVTDPTRLSSLVGPGMGDVHWAACRNVTPHAARP